MLDTPCGLTRREKPCQGPFFRARLVEPDIGDPHIPPLVRGHPVRAVEQPRPPRPQLHTGPDVNLNHGALPEGSLVRHNVVRARDDRSVPPRPARAVEDVHGPSVRREPDAADLAHVRDLGEAVAEG